MKHNERDDLNLLKSYDVLAKLKITTSTMYRRIGRGHLPRPIKRGRQSFWLETEIDAYQIESTRNCGRHSPARGNRVHRVRHLINSSRNEELFNQGDKMNSDKYELQTPLQAKTRDWILEMDPNVFITFTFRAENGVSYDQANKIYGKFASKMRIRFFPKNSKRRLLMVPVVEGYGKNRTCSETSKREERTHIHCLMRLPGDPMLYMEAIRKLWVSSSRACGNPNIYCPSDKRWFVSLVTLEDKINFTNYALKTCGQDTEAVLWKFVPPRSKI